MLDPYYEWGERAPSRPGSTDGRGGQTLLRDLTVTVDDATVTQAHVISALANLNVV